MGNDFYGHLTFDLDPKNKIATKYTLLYLINSFGIHMGKEFIESNIDNEFVKGMSCFMYKECKLYYHPDIYLCMEESKGNGLAKRYDSLYLEPTISLIKKQGKDPNDFVQEDANKLVEKLKEGGYVDDSMNVTEASIQLDYDISTRCWDEERIKEGINILSNYITNEYIGMIEDEDKTYKKEFGRFNKLEINHWSFCGEWCTDYFPTSSCTDPHCLHLHELGVKEGIAQSESILKI